ncbi:MAG: 2-phosphosulfolactate phosphatase, partial [Amnibacterium sp.]
PNGAALCAAADAAGAGVLAGCLRNASAVAAEVRARLEADPRLTALVIAAGERWPDGSLRVALEDLAGAARILAALPAALRSPEAGAAASVGIAEADLAGCGSARELARSGWSEDVRIALTLDTSATVPILDEGWFRPSCRG